MDLSEESTTETSVHQEQDTALSADEHDSTLGDEPSIRTSSPESFIYNYRFEHGRRYHAFGQSDYFLPNDEREQRRLDLVHLIFRMILGGTLYTAPIDESNLGRVLDVGTGTGIWAMELADKCPSAFVIGTDISPIQPEWVPPNCQFYVDDVETEWTYTEFFDFIHGRCLAGSIADWPMFYDRALRNLKPGGWVEIQELEPLIAADDDSMDEAPWCRDGVQEVIEASVRVGKRLNVAHRHQRWMKDAGFVNVSEDVYKIPIGAWAKDPTLKEIGRVQRVHMIEAVAAYSTAYYTRILEHSLEHAQTLQSMATAELRNPRLHLFSRWYFVRGQRPTA